MKYFKNKHISKGTYPLVNKSNINYFLILIPQHREILGIIKLSTH